jgi:hypothetical protein
MRYILLIQNTETWNELSQEDRVFTHSGGEEA